MSLGPAQQFEIELLMRDGWELQHDSRRKVRAWRLWRRDPYLGITVPRHAHGRSCQALLAAGKLEQFRPQTYGLTWYRLKGEKA